MNLQSFILEIIFAFLLLLIMNYLKNKKISFKDILILPTIFMIFLASLLPWFKNDTFLVIVFYLIFDLINVFILTKKQVLLNEKEYYKTFFMTLLISFLVYYFYLLKVENAFVDMNIFKNFIWILIFLYFYQKLGSLNFEEKEIKKDEEAAFQEYVVINYARLKNKYHYLIKSKDLEIENLLYSILIYENYLHGTIYRVFQQLKNHIKKGNGIYGIAQLEVDHYITDEESIVMLKDKLQNKLKRLKKSTSKEDIIKKLITEKYKETEDKNKIQMILTIIINFQKDN